MKKWVWIGATIFVLTFLVGCISKQQQEYKEAIEKQLMPEFTNAELAGTYRCFARHGYDQVEIKEDGEIIVDEYESGEQVIYKYTVVGNILQITNTKTNEVNNCHIKAIENGKIKFNTLGGKYCPLAWAVDYLTETN